MDTGVHGTVPGASNLLGPYETWMFGPGRTYDLAGLQLADQACLSCVAEFPGGASVAEVERTCKAPRGSVRYVLPILYRPDGFRPSFIPFLLNGTAPDAPTLDGVEAITNALGRFMAASQEGRGQRGYFRLNFPVRAETLDPRYPGRRAKAPSVVDPALDRTKPIVIAAVIDDGIPFAHAAYRHRAGTRMDYCWSQGARGAEAPSGAVPFGREFVRAEINEMLAECGGDEDAVYHRAGLSSRPGLPPMPLDLAGSHGSHVLDLAAGRWPEDDAAQVRVIAVDLPPTSTWETSGYGTDMFLLSALHYIFDRAARIAASVGLPDGLPVVINLSFGYSGGPHDQTGFLEAAMDELILARRAHAPTALVIPSGNSFQDRLTALIGNEDFLPHPDGETEVAELLWDAPACDATSTLLELWYPPETERSDIRVQVIAPGTEMPANSGPIVEREPGRFMAGDLKVDGRIVGQFGIEKHRDRRWRVSVILAPTEPRALPPEPGHGAATAGVWTVRFLRKRGESLPVLRMQDGGAVRGAIQCRVQIDTNSLQGGTGARQSAFQSAAYVPVGEDGAPGSDDAAGPVRRFGSLNGLAAMQTALVVGGTVESTGLAVAYSSAGALRTSATGTGAVAVDKQVDLSAPSDRSGWKEGVIAAGTRSGTCFAMRGTSVASPQAARRLLEAFLKKKAAPKTRDNYLSPMQAGAGGITEAVVDGIGPGGRQRLGKIRLKALSRDRI